MSDPGFEELERDFSEVMAILREGPLPPPDETPDESVWLAIANGVGGDIGAEANRLDRERSERTAPEVAPVVSLDERRSRGRRFAIMTAVAAAFLLVAVPVGLALGGDGNGRTAELLALGGFDGAGTAELNGRTLAVDLDSADPPAGSFYELWLLDLDGAELRDLRSLGRVGPDGSYTVPEDVDLDRFSVVDVSIEPDDGNPDHSGDSVLRGPLHDT
ncbi:MAG: anti-sigma factor [Acidimicrobiales bacterium]